MRKKKKFLNDVEKHSRTFSGFFMKFFTTDALERVEKLEKAGMDEEFVHSYHFNCKEMPECNEAVKHSNSKKIQ